MREVRIHITCDWCHEEIGEEDVGEIKITIGSQTYEGDVCPDCRGGMIPPMRPVTKTRKRTRKAPA